MGNSKEAEAFTLPSYDQATSGGASHNVVAHPLEFHVYRSGGFFNKDDIVTGPDKQHVLYHLDFPNTFSGRWDMRLCRGGPGGPDVAKIEKGAWSDSFIITMAVDGKEFKCGRTGFFSPKYEFQCAGNTEWYTWKADGAFLRQYDYSLYHTAELESGKPKEQCKVIAHWRTPSWSISKDGTLLIQPDHAHEQELILATALGIEERARERRERRR